MPAGVGIGIAIWPSFVVPPDATKDILKTTGALLDQITKWARSLPVAVAEAAASEVAEGSRQGNRPGRIDTQRVRMIGLYGPIPNHS